MLIYIGIFLLAIGFGYFIWFKVTRDRRNIIQLYRAYKAKRPDLDDDKIFDYIVQTLNPEGISFEHLRMAKSWYKGKNIKEFARGIWDFEKQFSQKP